MHFTFIFTKKYSKVIPRGDDMLRDKRQFDAVEQIVRQQGKLGILRSKRGRFYIG